MRRLTEIKWNYLLQRSYIRVCSGATCFIGNNVRIKNCRIILSPGSSLSIADNVSIENSTISISKGKCIIKEHCIIGASSVSVLINIEDGEMLLDHHSKLSTRRIWIRYGGILKIGHYTNINEGSEVRCDESVFIGDYNQISYQVNIWDTNTHCILPKEERRNLAERYFPYFGKELSKPVTAPIQIGNDCWIGEKSSILKGCTIGDEVIVGYNTLLSNKEIPNGKKVVSDIKLQIL